MNSAYKVSVIIPTHNRQQYVCEAITSALNQTVPIHEIIVVDDGSTDNTESILLARFDDRIRYIKQANQGPAEARNSGIRESTGDWLAFLDSDDLWEPNKLETQIRFLEKYPNEKIGIVDSFSICKDAAENILHKGTCVKRGDSFKELLCMNTINGTPSVLMRKACVADVGYMDTNLGGAEDHEYWLRVASKYEIHTVERFLTIIRKHSANVSNNRSFMIDNYKLFESIITSRYRDRLTKEDKRKIKAHRLQYSMIQSFKTRNFSKYRSEMRDALRTYPQIAVTMPRKYYLLFILSCFHIKLIELIYRKFDT